MSDLAGAVALVTGGASGIGRATAARLAMAGAQVATLDTAESEPHDGVLQLHTDVTDAHGVPGAVDEAVAHLGGLDLLVNNAGIGAVGTVEEGDESSWQRVLDVNLMGLVRVTRAALPSLRRSSRAAIVNVASIAATAGLPRRACYSASKGAVLSLTLAMAADLVADGVRVNCVCPGTIGTPWVRRLLDGAADPQAELAALEQRQPLGRLGTAEEVAEVIAFLLSPAAGFVTGAAWPVDGGMAGLRVASEATPAS